MIESTITNNLLILSSDVLDILQPQSIYQIGSSTIPFITHARDTDLLIYSKNSNLTECRHCVRQLNTPYDIHITSTKNPRVTAYPHLFHYAKLLWGDAAESADLLNDKILQQDSLQYWLPLVMRPQTFKRLYHIQIILSVLQRGSYSLNDEDIQNINLLHSFDKSTDPSLVEQWRHRIYNSILDVAQQYNINLNGAAI